VLLITASPEKTLTGSAFETGGIDAATAENSFIVASKIVADDADKIYMRKKTPGNSKISCNTADDAILFSVWTFNSIERNGTYDEQGHGVLLEPSFRINIFQQLRRGALL